MPRARATDQRIGQGAIEPQGGPRTGPAIADESGDGIDDLNYRQARTALDLTLSELQSSELDVETMADLYRRALRYADRCEAVLEQVEQEVMQWNPQEPSKEPEPFAP
jgi:exodeoxyribonuclease VII small subunit